LNSNAISGSGKWNKLLNLKLLDKGSEIIDWRFNLNNLKRKRRQTNRVDKIFTKSEVVIMQEIAGK
jgi:hypothetical protein